MKHGHETPWIKMKQFVSWSWNTLFHANETPWIRDGDHTYIDFFYWFLVHGVSLRCFMLFHAVSLLFHCCFIAVSCCFIAVSRCFIVLFHGVSRCFIALFHPVSWPRNRCSGNEPLCIFGYNLILYFIQKLTLLFKVRIFDVDWYRRQNDWLRNIILKLIRNMI